MLLWISIHFAAKLIQNGYCLRSSSKKLACASHATVLWQGLKGQTANCVRSARNFSTMPTLDRNPSQFKLSSLTIFLGEEMKFGSLGQEGHYHYGNCIGAFNMCAIHPAYLWLLRTTAVCLQSITIISEKKFTVQRNGTCFSASVVARVD